MDHVLLKSGLDNFEHYLLMYEMSATEHCLCIFDTAFLLDWNEN